MALLRFIKQDKLFEKLRWACLAVSCNDDGRPALKLLCVEKINGRMHFTGCDGNRVHRFITDIDSRFEDTEQGLYKITKITKSALHILKNSDETPYPNINSVIPENTDRAKLLEFKYADNGASIHSVYAAVTRLMDPDYALDAKLFAELLSAGLDGKEVTIKILNTTSNAFVIIGAENLFGLLMPIKIRSDNLIIEEPEETEDGANLLD